MRAAAMLLIALVGAVAASGCEDKRPNKCKPKALTRCEKSKNLRKKCALSCGVCSVGAAAAAAACADGKTVGLSGRPVAVRRPARRRGMAPA